MMKCQYLLSAALFTAVVVNTSLTYAQSDVEPPARQNLSCDPGQTIVAKCLNKIRYEADEMETYIRGVILCQAGSESFMSYQLRNDGGDQYSDLFQAEVIQHPGKKELGLPIPIKYSTLYGVDGYIFGLSKDHKQGLGYSSFVHQDILNQMTCTGQ